MNLVEIKKPLTLWNSNRIDIAAKILYIKYLEAKIDSTYGEEIYLNHLKVWNNLVEKEPIKEGANDYIQSFNKIILNVKNNNFDFKKSPILLNTQNDVINGSHRLAAAIFYDKPVYIQYSENFLGQANCNYELFQSHNNLYGKLNKQYLESMVMEYIERKKGQVFVITLFPAAKGFDNQIVEKIKEFGDVIYRKDFFIKKSNGINVVKILYEGEEWLKKSGGYVKAELSFPEDGFVRMFFVEINNSKDLSRLKQVLREYFKIGKNSLHINDTIEETLRISKHFLNENTINFINSFTHRDVFPTSSKLFKEFKKQIRKEKINNEDLMIVGSFVLSLYNVRDINDLDYVSKNEIPLGGDFDRHNEYFQSLDFNIDAILFNPQNYFYYQGIKVMSIDMTKMFKMKRQEIKDKKDLLVLREKEQHTLTNDEFEYLLSLVENIKKDFIKTSEFHTANEILLKRLDDIEEDSKDFKSDIQNLTSMIAGMKQSYKKPFLISFMEKPLLLGSKFISKINNLRHEV